MLPYFDEPTWQLGPLTIYAFGIAVALAVWIGLSMLDRRFVRVGLDAKVGQRLVPRMLIGGIIGAHLFSVLFYFPDKIAADPWLLLRLWDDVSSFGGMIGGVLGAVLFLRTRPEMAVRRQVLGYLDAVAFVFPFALAIGRIGCALAHDHPGAMTTFPLAISLKTQAARDYFASVAGAASIQSVPSGTAMGFHDLGLDELLFLALIVVPAFTFWNRRQRPTGFYLFAFPALYMPVRFALDMLRVADARYLSLTPAQWAAALIMVALLVVVLRGRIDAVSGVPFARTARRPAE
jgi:phosphatidylglycerol:prolipoprotein diacylglycerol transferase